MWEKASLPLRAAPVLYDCAMPAATVTAAVSADWARFRPAALGGVTVMNAHFRAHSFERHSHETWSIGVTRSGVQTFNCGGALHASLPGDVMLFNPDQPHDGQRGSDEGFGYAMLYVDGAVVDSCRDRDAGLSAVSHFARPVVRDAAMGRAVARAIEASSESGESLRAEELTRALLQDLLLRYGDSRIGGRALAGAPRLDRVRDLLRARFDEDLTVEALAREAGLSRAHLSRAFARQFGVPPHIFLNTVRVEQAQRLLLAGQSPVEVALACGFADQSHLNRRFKGKVGLAPGAWLRQMRAG